MHTNANIQIYLILRFRSHEPPCSCLWLYHVLLILNYIDIINTVVHLQSQASLTRKILYSLGMHDAECQLLHDEENNYNDVVGRILDATVSILY